MRSKYFFEEFKDEIKEDHEKFKTFLDSADISPQRCSHKGKVKIVNGILKCSCGAAWGGSELNILFDYFNKV